MPDVKIEPAEISDSIDGYTAGFVGRRWFVQPGEAVLADSDDRIVVFTAEPGAGRSY